MTRVVGRALARVKDASPPLSKGHEQDRIEDASCGAGLLLSAREGGNRTCVARPMRLILRVEARYAPN